MAESAQDGSAYLREYLVSETQAESIFIYASDSTLKRVNLQLVLD